MEARDLPAVCELETQAGLSTSGIAAYRRRLSDPNGLLLVAAGEGEIVGLFSGWLIVDELEIDNVVVAPAYRRQGIGRRLIDEALNAAQERGARSAILEVRASNEAALRLYKNLGFVVVGQRPAYYRNPIEVALLFRLELQGRPVAYK
jgi:ribosomal-protein-alanine N-acetyltransferase